MAEGDRDVPSLFGLLQCGWETQRAIENGKVPSGSEKFKLMLSEGIGALESATEFVHQAAVFSSNEDLEEVTTTDMKYLLLPALLGDLTLQVMEGDRLETISRARACLVDYLQRCKSYGITHEDPPEPIQAGTPVPLQGREGYVPGRLGQQGGVNLEQLARERQAKIVRLKAQKQLEKKLEECGDLLNIVSQQQEQQKQHKHSLDEDTLREHTVTALRLWIYKSQDLVRSIDQETEILQMMKCKNSSKESDREGANAVARQPDSASSRPPLKPVVITKEMLQSGVFGLGYPSRPMITLEQFFEEKYKKEMEERRQQQRIAAQSGRRQGKEEGGEEGGEEGEEEEEEEESEESLKRAREFDEFKDSNRRGCGNRKNMG